MKRNERASPVVVGSLDEKGQGLVEYALILVLVAIVVIAILLMLGPVVGNVFSEVTAALLDPTSLGGPIVSVSAARTGGGHGNDVIVTVTVSESTTVTVTDSQNASPISISCSGTCQGTLIGVGLNSGTVKATAEGRSKKANYPPQL
jgi:pilus assembly protein Flp/PilA